MTHEDDETIYGFTRGERERILKMLEDHERARWLWSTVGVAAKWVTSVSAATVIFITATKWGLGELVKWRP
jgi:hypothetical protein